MSDCHVCVCVRVGDGIRREKEDKPILQWRTHLPLLSF